MTIRKRTGESLNREERERQILRRTLCIAAVLAAAIALNVFYVARMKGHFYHFSSLNGYEISGMTADQIVKLFDSYGDSTFVYLRENGQVEMMASLTKLGYTVDEQQLRTDLDELLQSQRKVLPWHLIFPQKYSIVVPMNLDETALKSVVLAENLSSPRVETKNAVLKRNDDGFYIEDEVYGTELRDADLQRLVKNAVQSFELDVTGEMLDVEIPEDIYIKPEITKNSSELNSMMDIYDRYGKAEITYVFGNETEKVDWETVEGWIKVKEGVAELDEETIYNFLYDFATRHNTIYEPRTFVNTYGRTVTLDNNEYGYRVDLDGEYFQILEDLEKNTSIEREPVYEIAGYSRNGNNDLNGNYIEVDLTGQHLWMYKEGSLILETDVVTGTPNGTRETVQGAYPIPYKASPFNLVGQGGGGSASWDVEVKYWMPFCDGQGLHDASWRAAFGGNIYQTYGSHGCVNLPEYAAAVIYQNVGTNMPIVLYK